MGNITMQGVKTLYNATKDDLKMETVSEALNDLAGFDVMPTVNTLSLVFRILSIIATVYFCAKYKRWFDNRAKYEELIDKIQALERLINENKQAAQVQTEERRPKVIRKPTLCYGEVPCNPLEVLDLRRFKEDVVSYGMHSPFVKWILNSWATQNRIIPQEWKDLVAATLEAGPQLQWQIWWKEEARAIEEQNRARGINISQDQLLGEGQYANLQRQLEFDDPILELCQLAALNAWDKVKEPGKSSESLSTIRQGPKEAFTDFLQRLTPAVNRIASDPEIRQLIIEVLAFEKANSECKRVIRPLKARSAPIAEWIRNTADIGSHTSDETSIEEIIAKGLRKRQTVKCLGCGKQGHFKRDCRQSVTRNNVFF